MFLVFLVIIVLEYPPTYVSSKEVVWKRRTGNVPDDPIGPVVCGTNEYGLFGNGDVGDITTDGCVLVGRANLWSDISTFTNVYAGKDHTFVQVGGARWYRVGTNLGYILSSSEDDIIINRYKAPREYVLEGENLKHQSSKYFHGGWINDKNETFFGGDGKYGKNCNGTTVDHLISKVHLDNCSVVSHVSAGYSHSLIICSEQNGNGTVVRRLKGCGCNEQGQLGILKEEQGPIIFSTPTDFVIEEGEEVPLTASAGRYFTVVLTESRKIYFSGIISNGTSYQFPPNTVPGTIIEMTRDYFLEPQKQGYIAETLHAGEHHFLVLFKHPTSGRSMIGCFGLNEKMSVGPYEFLPQNAVDEYIIPAEDLDGLSIKYVLASKYNNAFFTEETGERGGKVYHWGYDFLNKSSPGIARPMKIVVETEEGKQDLFIDFHMSSVHFSVITEDAFYCMGDNSNFACGVVPQGYVYPAGETVDGELVIKEAESNVFEEVNIVFLATAKFQAVGISDTFDVYTWGTNADISLESDWRTSRIPKKMDYFSDKNVIKGSIDARSARMLTDAGWVFTWGKNDMGTLGVDSPDDPVVSPIEVKIRDNEQQSKKRVRDVCSGHKHVVYQTIDGEIYVNGDCSRGQCGMGEGVGTINLPKKLDSFNHSKTNEAVRIEKMCCAAYGTMMLDNQGNVLFQGMLDNNERDFDRWFIPKVVFNSSDAGGPIDKDRVDLVCGQSVQFIIVDQRRYWLLGRDNQQPHPEKVEKLWQDVFDGPVINADCEYSCAFVTAKGSAFGWGENQNLQASYKNRTAFIEVPEPYGLPFPVHKAVVSLYATFFLGATECNGILSGSPNVCNAHGACVDRQCKCHSHYVGDEKLNDCQHLTCNNTIGNKGCNNHGTCKPYDECSCTKGLWSNNCDSTVSSNCDSPSVPKDFNKGYCMFSVCDGGPHGPCNGDRGNCSRVLDNTTKEYVQKCACETGWWGDVCQYSQETKTALEILIGGVAVLLIAVFVFGVVIRLLLSCADKEKEKERDVLEKQIKKVGNEVEKSEREKAVLAEQIKKVENIVENSEKEKAVRTKLNKVITTVSTAGIEDFWVDPNFKPKRGSFGTVFRVKIDPRVMKSIRDSLPKGIRIENDFALKLLHPHISSIRKKMLKEFSCNVELMQRNVCQTYACLFTKIVGNSELVKKTWCSYTGRDKTEFDTEKVRSEHGHFNLEEKCGIIIMEYCHGTVKDILKVEDKRQSMFGNAKNFLYFLGDVVLGLLRLHDHRYVHFDIKYDNIFYKPVVNRKPDNGDVSKKPSDVEDIGESDDSSEEPVFTVEENPPKVDELSPLLGKKNKPDEPRLDENEAEVDGDLYSILTKAKDKEWVFQIGDLGKTKKVTIDNSNLLENVESQPSSDSSDNSSSVGPSVGNPNYMPPELRIISIAQTTEYPWTKYDVFSLGVACVDIFAKNKVANRFLNLEESSSGVAEYFSKMHKRIDEDDNCPKCFRELFKKMVAPEKERISSVDLKKEVEMLLRDVMKAPEEYYTNWDFLKKEGK